MRSINLVGIVSMALMLGATAFGAGCGDDAEGGTGGGTTASSTTTTSATTGTGGGDEGGGGAGGEDSGEGGAGGEDADCVTCSAPLLQDADPADLCESSVPKYTALTACICEACGAAEGDPCFEVCTTEGGEQSAECTTCGEMAATTAEGACAAEGTACLQDMPE
ncbi:hypothetical protein BE08_07880 [Sorangium cellulosum]|uniref:Secreted protein n=1 Tax=Sorangium cellulosum TaxID=56 RepID=A0A150P441_SORCE|nr:hypothetical protein BE08_07880 [Sorangium cellulosum]